MPSHHPRDWRSIAEQVCKETDSAKLTELVSEFNRVLSENIEISQRADMPREQRIFKSAGTQEG